MSFELLDPVKNRDKWLRVLDRLPTDRRDVHWTPDYVGAEAMRGYFPRLAVYTYQDHVVCQPIVVRDVFPLEMGQPGDPPEVFWSCRDIASPYGYGGPLSSHGNQLYEWFNRSLCSWARENRVITEFCALHPFMLQHQLGIMKVEPAIKPKERKQVVWMDLTGNWRDDYHQNRRHGVERAKRAGVRVEMSMNPESFMRLYKLTMLRKRASARWFFTEEYLRAVCETGMIFYARTDDLVHCAALVLGQAGHTAYYHLTGNAFDNSQFRANDLLLDEVAAAMSRQGCKRLHLGGGASSDAKDSVLTFKSGFSDLRAPAMSYFRVFDEVTYKALCMYKAQRELKETGAEFTTVFEPMYRREVS